VVAEQALTFVDDLEERFGARRLELLERRRERGPLRLQAPTGDWKVPPPAPGLEDRRVEITAPATAKMIRTALTCGAKGFMADFEDSLSPTWENVVGGQAALSEAIDTILGDDTATLLVRPRGWHLHEKHHRGVSASLFDAGVYLFDNARKLVDKGVGPYFYLPKLESHLEARLWNDVFTHAEDELGLDRGAIRATVLVETLPAAFEMDEILYELREHSAGLNAGRWDYIFSAIKNNPDVVLPQRNDVTMTVPFMRAYTELLVQTCHRRGAHAMGGMSALIPSRKDPEANEKAIAGVRADKEREAAAGFDGTWVAHPDLVPVAMAAFERPNQLDRQRDDVEVTAEQLLDLASTPGAITEAGLRNDVNVGIQYISSWLRGNGAAAIYGLMEDAATAEIARSQVWQWVRHEARLDDGRTVTPDLVRRIATEELERIRTEVGDDEWFEREGRPRESRELFEQVALSGEGFVEFLTLPAYERLP
jgi:malate synthase